MAYEFKNLNEIPTQDAPTENTTIMAFEGGVPKQIPAGRFDRIDRKGLVVDLRGYDLEKNGLTTISDINYDQIYEAFMAGQNVVFQIMSEGDVIFLTPLFLTVDLQPGLLIGMSNLVRQFEILFTNGSYHTPGPTGPV